MKNILMLGILLSSCFMTSAIQAGGATEAWGFAPETSLYLGTGIGTADQSQFEEGRSSAGKVYAGIRYRSVGAEVAYQKIGEAESSGIMPRDPSVKSDVNGLSASAIAYVPLAARTEIMAKLGATYWDQDNNSEVELTGVQSESDESGLSPLMGLGAQYRLYRNMTLRAEWERIFSTGEGYYESDIDMLSIGFNMSTL